jgi:hypothetical protein
MESVKFNYKAIELERPGLVAVGREGFGGQRGCSMVEIGMCGISLGLFCVCVCTGRLYIVMQNVCEVMFGRYGVHTQSHLSTDILCS